MAELNLETVIKSGVEKALNKPIVGGKSITEWAAIGMKAPRWISVKDKPPKEHKSIFYKFLGTPQWSSSMWKQESDKVVVYVSFPDGTGVVTTGCLHDSNWITTVSKALPQTVTHWMPLPKPPKEDKDENH